MAVFNTCNPKEPMLYYHTVFLFFAGLLLSTKDGSPIFMPMKSGIERLRKLNIKKLNALDKYLIYCLAFFTIYTIVEMIVSSITGMTHDALTVAVSGFCGGEAFFCCLLKRLKIQKEVDNE